MASQLLLSYMFLVIFNAVFFLVVTSVPYVAKGLGMADLTLAYSQTFFNILLLCGTTIMGWIMNRLDYKLSLALCFGSVGFCSAILVNATNPSMIILAQLLGLFMAGQQAVQNAIAQMTKAGSERTNAFSRLGLCFGLGFMFTPLISKLSTMMGNERAPLISASILSFIALPLVLFFIDDLKKPNSPSTKEDEIDSNSDQKSTKSISGLTLLRTDPNLRLLFILKVLLLSPAFIVFGSMGIYLMNKFEVSQTTNTLLQLDIGLSVMFANSVGISFLRRKYSEHQLIRIGAFVCLVCYAQFCYFEYLFQIWFILFALIQGITIAGNSADSLLSNSASHEQQGLILGLSNSAISAARTSAPTFGMFMSTKFGFGSLGLLGVGASCLAITLLFTNKSFKQNISESQEKERLKNE